MKAKVVLCAVLVFVISISSFTAEIPTKSKTRSIPNDVVIDNLINGINSENEGLKCSSTYFLGEYKSEYAVIPLLRILKSDDKEEARIMAALSLTKIGDARGIYAVKQAIKFDSSERVRKLCQGFYNDYLLNNE